MSHSEELAVLDEMRNVLNRKKLIFNKLDSFYQRLSENERPEGIHHFFEIEDSFREICESLYIRDPGISPFLEGDISGQLTDEIDNEEPAELVGELIEFANELDSSYPWLELEFRKYILETEANHLNPLTDADVSGRISHEARLPFIEETIYSGQTTLYKTRLPLDKYYRECSRKIERTKSFLEGIEDDVKLNEDFIEDIEELSQSISETQEEIDELLDEMKG